MHDIGRVGIYLIHGLVRFVSGFVEVAGKWAVWFLARICFNIFSLGQEGVEQHVGWWVSMCRRDVRDTKISHRLVKGKSPEYQLNVMTNISRGNALLINEGFVPCHIGDRSEVRVERLEV